MMRVRLLTALFGVALAACSATQDAPKAKGPRFFTPPPKPGASLTSSVQCTCRSCEPASCCQGSEGDPTAAGCGDGYDFSKCTLSVQSCTGRCYEVAWRVPVGTPCAKRQPPDCCRVD